MAESFKDKVADELHALGSKYYGLEDAVSLLKDDQEAREYLWAARTAIQRMPNFSQEYLEEKAPTLSDVIYGEIPGSKINYDKTFGKDWYKNFGDIDYGKVQHVAMKAGEDPKKVLHEMAEEATRRQRYDIAHGGIGSMATTIAFPRVSEAIEQGRDAEPAEWGMDVGQDIVYAVPYGGIIGRVASAIPKLAKFPRAVSLGKAAASNVTPPLINETMDAYHYDDEENPRSEFNPGDVASGTALNAVMPYAFKKTVGMGLKKFDINRVGKKIEEFGEGETAKEASKNIFNTVKPGPNGPSATSAQRAARAQYETMSPMAKGAIESKNHILFDIAAQDGKNLEEKTRRYLLSKGLSPDKYMVSPISGPVPKNSKAMMLNTSTTDNLVKAYDEIGLGATEGLKTAKDLLREEAAKNLVINKVGDYGYNGDPWQRVPYVGPYIHKKKAEDEAEQKKLKQAEDLYKKWEKKIQEVY